MSTLAKLMGAGGGAPEFWTAARVVRQGEVVVSPLDFELYMRRAATGTSATDPANDTTNYLAASYRRVTSIAATLGLGGAAGWGNATSAPAVAQMANPAFSAGVRTSMLSLSGRGKIKFLAARKRLAGAGGNMRVEIIVDGRVLFDDTLLSGAAATNTYWPFLGGLIPTATTGDYCPIPEDLEFKRGADVFLTCATSIPSGTFEFWYAFQGDS